jgi:hypothetical protein
MATLDKVSKTLSQEQNMNKRARRVTQVVKRLPGKPLQGFGFNFQ